MGKNESKHYFVEKNCKNSLIYLYNKGFANGCIGWSENEDRDALRVPVVGLF